MSVLQIKQLYNYDRNPNSGFLLFLYAPFGLIIFTLRVFISLIVLILGYVLPSAEIFHKILFKLTCLALGITINVKNPDKKEDVEVYVSNCLSHFDHLAVHGVTGAVMPGQKMSTVLLRALGMYDFGNIRDWEEFKKNVSLVISEKKIPVYFRPEAKMTNGKGILKFKTYPFSFSLRVQPICIEVTRPFVDISLTTLGSSYWYNVFFFMFSPCTIYNLKFLPALEKKNLSDSNFAEIVRQNIATGLNVQTTDYSNTDLLEWEKRYLIERHNAAFARRQNSADHHNPHVHRMTLQVQEVLPDVPYDPIYRDLLRTKSVDHTISNILEGHVRYTPESRSTRNLPSSSTSVPSSSTSSTQPSSQGFSTAAATFPKSVHERNLSFQERKKQLIENARKRYIEKHNLNITLNNC